MTSAPPTRIDDERLDLLDALIYADGFDCALTLEELWRYGRAAIGRDELRRRLREDPSLRRLVIERDGIFGFADRPALIDQRPSTIEHARRLERRALRVARVLQHVPFVRGLVLTGSAAAGHAAGDADADLMVIVAKARLGTAFVLLGSVSRLFKRRLFCPNYYVCEASVEMSPHSLYVARELAQARMLVGDGSALRQGNRWLDAVFPNAGTPPEQPASRGSSSVGRWVEAALSGRLGDRLERCAQTIAVARLRAHHGRIDEDVPAEAMAGFLAGRELRFHGGHREQTTLRHYAARRAQIARRLQTLDCEPA